MFLVDNNKGKLGLNDLWLNSVMVCQHGLLKEHYFTQNSPFFLLKVKKSGTLI